MDCAFSLSVSFSSSVQRQFCRALDRAHRDVGVCFVHMRQLQQMVAQKALLARNILCHDLEHEVHAACHGVALQHLRVADDRFFELGQIPPAVA